MIQMTLFLFVTLLVGIPVAAYAVASSCMKRNQQIYNNLPALGQIRVTREKALLSALLGAIGATAFAILVGAITHPILGIATFAIASRWAYNNWVENCEVIANANKRKDEILH